MRAAPRRAAAQCALLVAPRPVPPSRVMLAAPRRPRLRTTPARLACPGLRTAVVASSAAAAPAGAPGSASSNWWLKIGGDDDPRLLPPESLRTVAGRLAVLAREDGKLLAVASFFMVAAALAELAIPMYLSRAIAAATAGGGDAVAFRTAIRKLLALAVAFGVLSGARGATFSFVNQRLVRRLREQLFGALVRQPVSFFDEHDVGELTSRLGADSAAVARAVCTNVNVLARNALQVVIGSVLLATLSLPLAGAAMGVTALLWAVTERYGRFSRRAARALQDVTAGANRVAEEAFTLARTVRAAGTEATETARYGAQTRAMHDVNSRQTAAYGLYVSASNSLYHVANVTALGIAGAAALSGGAAGLSAETLTTFVLYLELVLCASLAVSDQWPVIADALGAGERVLALAAAPPAPQIAAGLVPAGPPQGLLELRDCWFQFPGRPPALRGVSLTLRPGETVALVGASGSGKTTLASLLQRLYDPSRGEVLLDGVPLRALDAAWYRAQLGVVSQEPRLFSDTIAANIAYGTAGLTAAQVQAAARVANAHEFVSKLPLGYDTVVGAVGLSGGQKQRIAIARALARDPAILLLDEATSALDTESEALVQEALEEAMAGGSSGGRRRRTCLVIAHRMSTVRRADRIVVLHSGVVAEEGTHEQLMALAGGIYRSLVLRQSGTTIPDMAPHSSWPRVGGSAAVAAVEAPAVGADEADAHTRTHRGDASAAPPG